MRTRRSEEEHAIITRGAEAPGEEAELDPQEQVVDGGELPSAMTPTNITSPTAHATSARAWPMQRDQRLGEREGEDERGAAARRAGEVDAAEVELVAEEDLADGRADGAAGDHAEAADRPPRSNDELLADPVRKSSCLPGARRAGELREQRGLHGLEEQDRDAGEEEPDDEVGGGVALALGLREHEHAEAARS